MSISKRIEYLVSSGESPIAKEVVDPSGIAKTMRLLPIVPYAGSGNASSHSWLDFFKSIVQMSPTFSACVNKKTGYAFGAPTMVLPDGEHSTAQYFNESISRFGFSGDGGDTLGAFCRDVNKQLETGGFCVARIAVSTVSGQSFCKMSAIPLGMALKVKDVSTGFEGVVISSSFDYQYLRKNKPEILPIFPSFTESNGVLQAAFMFKAGGAVHYGRPPAIACVMPAYEEMLLVSSRIISAKSHFTPRVILEFEGSDPTDQGFPIVDGSSERDGANPDEGKSFVERFTERYTNAGDNPSQVMAIERPIGASPMVVAQIQPMAGHEYHRAISEIARDSILAAHGCTPRFMGFEASSGFSKDAFLNDYVVNMEPVIDLDRRRTLEPLNNVLSILYEMFPTLKVNDGRLHFIEPIYDALKEIK